MGPLVSCQLAQKITGCPPDIDVRPTRVNVRYHYSRRKPYRLKGGIIATARPHLGRWAIKQPDI